MNQIYAIDSTRISHQEYWWGTQSPLVLLGWILKWLRVRIPGSTDDPNFESTTPWVVPALPDEVMTRFQPLGAELATLGFYDVAYHCFRDPGTQTTIYWATFLHESGTHFARIHQRLWSKSQKVSRALYPMFLTEFTDGTFFVSSSGKPDMVTPPTVPMNRMYGAPTGKLWEAHLQQVAAYGAQRMPARVATPEEALAATERHHRLLRDFNLARGVFRARTEKEQAQATAAASAIAQAEAGGLQHADVLVELDKLQDKKGGWGNALVLLVASIVVFVIAARRQWDLKFALWLVPVLLLHEGGHWLAMRTFGYRNLKMFFIPFFGAAVTGRHWNVPGWKKAIVSLAGPVPGILLGCALAIVAIFIKQPWLTQLTLLLLGLNAFNLLPFLPLDGGHVLHATLFCRNRWLDIAFRIAAIACMLLLGLVSTVSGGFSPLLVVAIVLGLSLPLAFKMGKVVDELRLKPLPPPLPEQDRIPAETAQVIIGALKAEQPKGVTSKILAQQTLTVYETLNARPPGAGATLGLLALHGGAFFAAILFCIVIAVIPRAESIGNFMSAAMAQPTHEASCKQSVQATRGPDAPKPGAPHVLFVTTCDARREAEDAYAKLASKLPGNAALTLFGDTLFLSLPSGDEAARERWFQQMQVYSTNTFVVVSNRPVSFSLMFLATNAAAASNLATELSAYGAVAGTHLVAPWSAAGRQPEYQKHLTMRRAWLDLDKTEHSWWKDPQVKALNTRMEAARRRGAMDEVARLSKEHEELVERIKAQQLEHKRAKLAGSPAEVLVDLHAQHSSLAVITNRAAHARLLREIAGHLGEIPYDGNRPAPALEAEGGYTGGARAASLLVTVTWGNLNDPQTSLPLLLDWLCEHRCASIKYDFHDYGYYEDEEALDGLPDEMP